MTRAAPVTSRAPVLPDASSALPLVFAKRKRIRKKTPRELSEDAVRHAQDSKLLNLTLDVNNLKQEIHSLAMQRSLVETRRLLTQTAPNGSSEKLIRHYFQLYRHGLDATKCEHRAFMDRCVHKDLVLGTTPFGIDMFFEQWRLHTQLFQIRLIELSSIHVASTDDDDGSCVVQCVIGNHGRISRATIAAVFPSALSSEVLVAKLIGREIVTTGTMRFYVSAEQQVVRLDVDVNMVLAFSELLHHNPHDVAALMGHAAIAEESMIQDVALDATDEASETREAPAPDVVDTSPPHNYTDDRYDQTRDAQGRVAGEDEGVYRADSRLSIDFLLS